MMAWVSGMAGMGLLVADHEDLSAFLLSKPAGICLLWAAYLLMRYKNQPINNEPLKEKDYESV